MAQVKAWPAAVLHKTSRVFGILLLEVDQISMLLYAEPVGIAEFKYLLEPIATQ
jgi:hypothetical protein